MMMTLRELHDWIVPLLDLQGDAMVVMGPWNFSGDFFEVEPVERIVLVPIYRETDVREYAEKRAWLGRAANPTPPVWPYKSLEQLTDGRPHKAAMVSWRGPVVAPEKGEG